MCTYLDGEAQRALGPYPVEIEHLGAISVVKLQVSPISSTKPCKTAWRRA
jgi:hypothetical protein